MTFTYSSQLLDYMQKKGKSTIIVELVECNNTEVEIAELHVYLIDEKRAEFFIQKKGYGVATTDVGRVLLPRFKLKYDDTVKFDLKKVLCFHSIAYQGIVLER